MVSVKRMGQMMKVAMLVMLSVNPHGVAKAHTTLDKGMSKKISKRLKNNTYKGGYEAYFEALAIRESSNNPKAVNAHGYLGKYQLGEEALIEAGLYEDDGDPRKNNWHGHWSKKAHALHVDSRKDFLEHEEVQDMAVRAYTKRNWEMIEHFHLDDHIGERVNGVEITPSGMLAGAHLVGIGGLKEFIEHRTDPTDGNGVNISEYIKKFNGYDTPFEHDGAGLAAS